MKPVAVGALAAIGLGYIAVLMSVPAQADTSGAGERLSLELNDLSDSTGGCLATFMVKNNLSAPLAQVAFEVVLFDGQGVVDRMMALDFSPLSKGKTRVRQFELAGAACKDISRILINDAAACEGSGIPETACIERLETKSRPAIEFGS